MKVSSVRAELFYVDCLTGGHEEADSGFSQICERYLKLRNFLRRTSPPSRMCSFLKKMLLSLLNKLIVFHGLLHKLYTAGGHRK
jgi:hypothetical protein